MAKMFYTLDEAAAKLGMSESDVQSLAESGQLQEFRDRDKLMFKDEGGNAVIHIASIQYTCGGTEA